MYFLSSFLSSFFFDLWDFLDNFFLLFFFDFLDFLDWELRLVESEFEEDEDDDDENDGSDPLSFWFVGS